MRSRGVRVIFRSLVCLLAVVGGGCAREFGPRTREDVLREIGEILEEDAYANGVDFGQWAAHVSTHRSQIDAAPTPESFAGAVNDALQEFGISHLGLMAPGEARRRYSGTRVGLGIRTGPADEGRLVLSVIEGGPGWKAGLRGGDVVVRLDGIMVDPERPLAFDDGQEVRIEWLRTGAPHEAIARIVVGPRASPPRLRWLEENVATLSVPTFIDELYDREAIEALFIEARSASGLILDMRSNPGGNSDNVRHLLGRLLPPESPLFADVYAEQAHEFTEEFPDRIPTVAAVVEWLGDERFYRPIVGDGDGETFAGPLVVLIDERCGSGGELGPATLRDLDRARLIGTPTQGKVRIGDRFQLTGDFVLRIPVGEFVTVTGRVIEGTPVVPDILLTPAETARDDVVFGVARKALKGGA